jgi:hypothetical protein
MSYAERESDARLAVMQARAEAAEKRLAQIADLAKQAESYCSRPNACGLDLNAILTVARGEGPE